MKSTMIVLALLLAGLRTNENWTADAASAKVQFTVSGPFGTVHGNFTGLKASIDFDEAHPESGSFTASVSVATISTGIGMRNNDLRNEDIWFQASKYPLISFSSKKVEKTASGFLASGTLTMKGNSRPMAIPFSFSSSGSTGLFKGDFKVNRQDFNLGNKGGSVGEVITIHLEIPVKKA